MSLIGQLVADVVQDPKVTGGAVVVMSGLGIFAILEKGAGLVILILSIILTSILIRNHFLKMKLLQIELDEKKQGKSEE